MRNHTHRSFALGWHSLTTGHRGTLPLSVYLGPKDTVILMPSSCCYARVAVKTGLQSHTITCGHCSKEVSEVPRVPTYGICLTQEDREKLLPLLSDAISESPALESVLETDIIASGLVPKLAAWLKQARRDEKRSASQTASHRTLYLSGP